MRVLICGAGVIGATLACFLARRGADVTVVERTGVGNAASGKSGGFLALDWCDGYELRDLARRSFALHADLAAELGGDAWGYRRLATYAGNIGRGGRALPWLGPEVDIAGRLGTPATTAQVHPALFTQAMMRTAQAHGATLVAGEVTGLVRDGDHVTGVAVGGRTLAGDAVVIAMGPWSVLAARWLDLPAVYGLKGHSLVFEAQVPAESLFLELRDGGDVLSPEVMPRADGTTYVCAISSESPLPLDPAAVVPDEGAMDRLAAICARIAPALSPDRIVARQACFRPVTRDGLPLIGALPGAPGAYVATGHSVWGMLNAPGTAEAMTALLLDGRATLDLSPFDPARLPPARL